MSSAAKNSRSRDFKTQFDRLPERIQRLAVAAFREFRKNPDHPALRRHKLSDTHKGQHRAGSFSVSITQKYRAIYVDVDGNNLWYWIGTHNDYDNFTGGK
jgi:hypothetical protein